MQRYCPRHSIHIAIDLILIKTIKNRGKVIVERKRSDGLDQLIVVTIWLRYLALIGGHKETAPGHVDKVGRQIGIDNDGAQCLQHLARSDRNLRLSLEEMTRSDGGQGLGAVLETIGVVDAMVLLNGQFLIEKVKRLLDAVAPEQPTADGGRLEGDHCSGKVGSAHLNGTLCQVVLVDTEGGDGKSGQQVALEAISERFVGPF